MTNSELTQVLLILLLLVAQALGWLFVKIRQLNSPELFSATRSSNACHLLTRMRDASRWHRPGQSRHSAGGKNMTSESIGGRLVDTWPMARKPELNVIHDVYDYPATARCSSCGKTMPTCRRWIISSADNLTWFTAQFRLHVEEDHPDWSGTLKDPMQLGGSEAA